MRISQVLLAGIAVIVAGAGSARAQDGGNELAKEVMGKFLSQYGMYPQEKIYVHTDREHYISGDTIWLRAHVVDAMTHAPADISKFVYADLIDPSGKVAYNIKLIARGGIYSGYIPLLEEAASGTYTLRTYTNFMKSAGQEYFPLKRIRVSDRALFSIPARMEFTHGRNGRIRGALTIQDLRDGRSIAYKNIYLAVNGTFIDVWEVGSRGRLNFSAKLEDSRARNVVTVEYDDFTRFFTIPAAADDFDVSFFPEGGYLLDGTGCTVGFKALRKDGTSVDVTGRIVDGDGNEITGLATIYKGMGMFAIVPYKGTKYYAECTGPEGNTLRFELPEIRDNTMALELKYTMGNIWVGVSSPYGFAPQTPLYVVMHTRGNPRVMSRIDNPGHYLKLDPASFPSGVLHVLLLDRNLNTISERLTFISNDDQAHSTVTTDNKSYGKREPVEVTATVTDAAGNPLQGSFSVAVTDSKLAEADSTSNILTELLLASDLRGYIEDPAWYFAPGNDLARTGLEALMLTQGWRRYDVPQMLRGEYQSPGESLEIGDEISGKVISLFGRKPVDDATVTLLYRDRMLFDQQNTDKKGAWAFSGFDIPEGSSIFVQALSDKRKKRVELAVDQLPLLPVDPALLISDPVAKEDTAQADTTFLHKVNTGLTAWGLDDAIALEEVVVTTKAPPRGFYSRDFLMGKAYDKKYIDKLDMYNMEMLLRRLAPFLETYGDSVTYKRKQVRIIYDNWDVDSLDVRAFLSLSTKDIDYIEIARDEQTYPFGFDFENGGPLYGAVIAVYSTGGMGMLNRVERNFNIRTISPLGYQKAAEFYSPRYETDEEKNVWANDRRITLYWQPDLRTGDDGRATFRFWSADIPQTTYSVIIEGVTDDGRIVRSSGTVKVE